MWSQRAAIEEINRSRIHVYYKAGRIALMSTNKMHADEVVINAPLVRSLLTAQFPQWAHLPIKRVASSGTDNAMYRLGRDRAVRLPRIPGAAPQVVKEQQWLPRLAPHLPLPIPVPLADGEPGEGYSFKWSVCPWLVGENATLEHISSPEQMAADLAHFIKSLQRIDPTGGPLPKHDGARGVPLVRRDTATRAAITNLHDLNMFTTHKAEVATTIWENALHAPMWEREGVWIHGDLQSGNLLAQRGRLSAVIDFGAMYIGDPACDTMPAWNLFSAEIRETFRRALQTDDATWARGRGWALSTAVIALPYYYRTNPSLANISRHSIAEVMADYERGL